MTKHRQTRSFARHSLEGIVAVLAFFGCAQRPPELTADERAGVHAALEGWRLAGLPVDFHDCDLSGVRVRRAKDAQDFWDHCQGLSSQHAACLQWESSARFFRPRQFPVVFLDFDQPSTATLAAHEIFHALTHCARMDWWAPGNTQHLDTRIWIGAGGELSAEGRARTLLTGTAPVW